MNAWFMICALVVVYTYVGYPLLIWMLSRRVKRAIPGPRLDQRPPISLILAVHNQQDSVARRVCELGAVVEAWGSDSELIFVSDGSTDRTAAVARANANACTCVAEMPRHLGKSAALMQARAIARHDILVLADVRQTWAPDTVDYLVANFTDPSVGAVSGEIFLEATPGVLAGVGLYWRYEKWLRKMEGNLHSTVGLSGPICAVRRELFPSIPSGTVLDDVYWPLCVAMRGYRVVYEPRARAFDRLPLAARDEFRRKIRTLSGNLQLCARLPSVLAPWRNPIWFQFISHKLMRLVVPWAMLGMLVISATQPQPAYRIALLAQGLFFLLALLGMRAWSRPKVLRTLAFTAASFLLLNAAAWMAFWVWMFGRSEQSWTQATYRNDADQEPVEDELGAVTSA